MCAIRKIINFVALFLAFSFVIMGYAAITDDMSIFGTAEYSGPPKGIYITDVEVISSQGVSSEEVSFTFPTNVKSVVDASGTGSITYKITVKNNTDYTYWYRGVTGLDELDGYHNDLIGVNNGITISTKDKLTDGTVTFNNSDWVPPNTTRVFYAVYYFWSGAAGGTVTTFVNFEFGARMASYGDEFLAILNDPERYPVLAGAFDAAYAENGTNILGNVGEDQEFFDNLFINDLVLDGKNVTMMVQRRDVNDRETGDSFSPSGETGCEYTVYITTEDPTTGTPTVYAVSYTREPSGEWVQIGELYEGTVSVGTYTDSTGDEYTSFDVPSWCATIKTYTVFTYKGQSVTYTVNFKDGNSYQQQQKIDDLMSMHDRELYNQLNNHQILKDAYKIIFTEHPDDSLQEVAMIRAAYYDALRFYEMRNQGQEFKLSETVQRAELLASVQALANAMEYYNQVHI